MTFLGTKAELTKEIEDRWGFVLGTSSSDYDTSLGLFAPRSERTERLLETENAVRLHNHAWKYVPSNKFFEHPSGAFFKPGVYRSGYEGGVARVAEFLNVGEHFAPVAPYVLFPDELPKLKASEMDQEERTQSTFNSRALSFYEEDTYNGFQVSFLPDHEEGEINANKEFSFPGPVIGALSPKIQAKEADAPVTVLSFNKAILAAAILGARDLENENYIVDKNGQIVFVDTEEFMAQNADEMRTLGIGCLGDFSLAGVNLTDTDLKALLDLLDQMPAPEEIDQYIRSIPILFKDSSVESLKNITVGELKEMRLDVNRTSRSETYFPTRKEEELMLFSEKQASSVVSRMGGVRRAVQTAIISRFFDRRLRKEPSPESSYTAWTTVFAADPQFESDTSYLLKLINEPQDSESIGTLSDGVRRICSLKKEHFQAHWAEQATGDIIIPSPKPGGRQRFHSASSLTRALSECEDSGSGTSSDGASSMVLPQRTHSAPPPQDEG